MLQFRKVIYKSKLIQTATKFFNALDQPEFKTFFQEKQELPGRGVDGVLHIAAMHKTKQEENSAVALPQEPCVCLAIISDLIFIELSDNILTEKPKLLKQS